MQNHIKKQGGETSSFEPHHYVERPTLGNFFEPQGAFDGRLLYKGEKITYIFYDVSDVISVHFDKNRKEIFYKGHHANNVKFGASEWMHLEKFRQAIHSNQQASENYLEAYEAALKILEQNLD